MNTTENNRLLAEFLNELTFDSEGQIKEDLEKLDFHYNWNSLMRVVERVETAETKDGRTFTIDMHIDSVLIFEYRLSANETVFTEGRGRLENLYNACIEFVKWWNEEQMYSAEG